MIKEPGAPHVSLVVRQEPGVRSFSNVFTVSRQDQGALSQELLICPHSGLGRIPTGKINEPPSLLRFTNTFIMRQKERDLQVSQN